MSNVSKIVFAVDYAESFRRGVNCPLPPRVELEVDVAALPAEDRELLAGRVLNSGELPARDEQGRYGTRGAPNRSGCWYRTVADAVYHGAAEGGVRLVLAPEPTLAGVLERLRCEETAIATYADRQAAEAQGKKLADRKTALEYASQPITQQQCTVRVDLHADGTIGLEQTHWSIPAGTIASQTATYLREYVVYHSTVRGDLTPEEDAAYQARHDRLDAESDSRKQAAVDIAAAELRAKHWQQRLDWIKQHGSLKLRRMVAEGIGYAKTYGIERAKYDADEFARALAEQRPGWRLIAADDLQQDVADVSLRALAILDAARTDKVSIEPVKLGKEKSTGKYVAWQRFRDVLIIWPAE